MRSYRRASDCSSSASSALASVDRAEAEAGALALGHARGGTAPARSRQAGLGLPVAALERFLRGDEALLQRHLRTQVVADRQRRSLFAQAHRGVGHRHRRAGRAGVVDLAAPAAAAGGDVGQQVLDLDA